MKTISRAIIFSFISIVVTSFWNSGFKVNYSPEVLVKTVLIFALFYFLIRPLTRIILIPVNWLTLGLLSIVVNFLLFYFFFTRFPYIQIQAWKFPGIEFSGIGIGPTQISYLFNILVSSLSLSFIIRVLELLL